MSQNTSVNSAALSREDKQRIFAEELAILGFTEEVLRRMEEIGVTRTGLAANLGVDPAAVTKLLGGENNFTLRTMVRIARALRSRLRFSLTPTKALAAWQTCSSEQFNVVHVNFTSQVQTYSAERSYPVRYGYDSVLTAPSLHD
jgi:plasmid maintenance system antidote protein VapI